MFTARLMDFPFLQPLAEGNWYASQQTKDGSWAWLLKLSRFLSQTFGVFWQVQWSSPISSFWTMFGIFLLLTDFGEMGPYCKLLFGCFPILVEIIELLISLVNSRMAPGELEPVFSSTTLCWSFSGAGARKISWSSPFLRYQCILQLLLGADEQLKLEFHPSPWDP